jgi:hypothetical protein
MAPVLAAKVWHYWISVALLLPVLLIIVGMGVAYVRRVVAARYPRQ